MKNNNISDCILVTGAGGFIGKHLLAYFRQYGYRIIAMDRIPINFESERIITFIMDFENDSITPILNDFKPRAIIHCAGSADVSLSFKDPVMDFTRNVFLLYKLLNEIRNWDTCCQFIFLSSAAVYGNPVKLPITEDMQLQPISPYGFHKQLCEQICNYFRKTSKINAIILRIFSAYGEGLKKQILWDIAGKLKSDNILKLFGTGHESRDFIHIDDIAQAIDCIMHSNTVYNVFNIANGIEIFIREIAEYMMVALGCNKSNLLFSGNKKVGDPDNWRADISRLISVGYKQKIDILTGINRYARWINNE